MRSNYVQYRTPQMKVLSVDQIEEIHSAACEILARTGSKIMNTKAKELLHGAGAHICDNNVVKIPAYMIDQAIRTAPKKVVMCNRDGERKINLTGHHVHYGCNPDNPEYIDPFTHERRLFVSADGRQLAKIIDQAKHIDFLLNACFSSDFPENVADRVIVMEMMLNQRKTVGFSCKDADSLLDIIDMAAIVCGGYDNLKQNPYIFHIQEPISPLIHDDNSIKEVMICAEKGVPLVYYPMPMGGATAPATSAGLLAQNHAESLTGLVIHQLAVPGAPFIYGGVASIMDMKSARFSYGAPELHLQCSALADIAHHFQLPIWGTAGCVDAKTVDPQAGAEIAMSCLMAGLSGANLIHDVGLMDQATVTCPEVLLLADEVIGMVKKILGGIDVNEDTLALDVIDEVGPGGNFISQEHTFNNFGNFWKPRFFDRTVYKKGEDVNLNKKLNEEAISIINNYEVPELDEAKVKELRTLEKKWLS